MARRLDDQPTVFALREDVVPAGQSSGSSLRPDTRRIFQAMKRPPEDGHEVFGLARIQGLTQSEAPEILDVSSNTVLRRLNRSMLLLSPELDELHPDGPSFPSPWTTGGGLAMAEDSHERHRLQGGTNA
jgi:DNA-directed RNA polymerase specialized sigma24 family protein